MESNIKTARPYAMAAFMQAQDESPTTGDSGNNAEHWSTMLSLLAGVTSDPIMQGVISNPKLKHIEVAALIIDVCGDALSQTGQNFVKVLAENSRLSIVNDIASAYESERARAEKRCDVSVISAQELSAAQQNDINVGMTRRLGTKVDITVTVDPQLIGGVIIRSGDMVIDASIRGRLAQLAQTLV